MNKPEQFLSTRSILIHVVPTMLLVMLVGSADRIIAVICKAVAGIALGLIVWGIRYGNAQNDLARYRRLRKGKKWYQSTIPEEIELSDRGDEAPPPFESRLQQFTKQDISTSAPPVHSKMPLWISKDVSFAKTAPRPTSFFRFLLERIQKLLQVH